MRLFIAAYPPAEALADLSSLVSTLAVGQPRRTGPVAAAGAARARAPDAGLPRRRPGRAPAGGRRRRSRRVSPAGTPGGSGATDGARRPDRRWRAVRPGQVHHRVGRRARGRRRAGRPGDRPAPGPARGAGAVRPEAVPAAHHAGPSRRPAARGGPRRRPGRAGPPRGPGVAGRASIDLVGSHQGPNITYEPAAFPRDLEPGSGFQIADHQAHASGPGPPLPTGGNSSSSLASVSSSSLIVERAQRVLELLDRARADDRRGHRRAGRAARPAPRRPGRRPRSAHSFSYASIAARCLASASADRPSVGARRRCPRRSCGSRR